MSNRVWLLLAMLVLGLASTPFAFRTLPNAHGSPGSLTPHSTIDINSNAGFGKGGSGVTSGAGTASQPYIIESWEISPASTTSYVGIFIANTTSYFVVRNVYLHGLTLGAEFSNVTHARIENVRAANNTNGIELYFSNNDTVQNSVISNDQQGIMITGGGHESVYNNTISYATVNGLVVSNSANNVTISGNRLSKNYLGLSITGAQHLMVIRNQFSADSRGIAVNLASFLWILENSFVSSGIYVELTASSFVYVYHNNFLDPANSPGVYITTGSSPSYWDNGYPSGGNYWIFYTGVDNCSGPQQNVCPHPDGIGDTPYTVQNSVYDHYPLMKPFGPAPNQAPSWPTGSMLTAARITLNNLTLTWNYVIGASKYHIYQFSRLIGNSSFPSFSIANLLLGGTYTFKVEAGDAWGNFTTDGPSLTVQDLAQGAYLEYSAKYVGSPYPGGETLIMNNFTDVGTDLDTVSSVSFAGDIGLQSLTGVPFSLSSGQNLVINMTWRIPVAAYLGNHTVTVTVGWQSRDPSTGTLYNGVPIVLTGHIQVQPAPPSPPTSTGPNGPSNSKSPTNSTRATTNILTALSLIGGLFLIPGLVGFSALLVVAAALVYRARSRAKPVGFSRACSKCGTVAKAGAVFCGTCGTRLVPEGAWS